MIKNLAKKISRLFIHIFWILPINKNKVFFSSFKGSSITCNPYYIYKQLIKEEKNLKIIWCCNNPELYYLANDGNVSFVKFNSMGYILSLISSHIIISNASLPTWIPYRKKQIIINTWHGGGAYKKVAADEFKTKEIISKEMQSAKDTTYFISSCKVFTEVMNKSTFVSLNKFLPIGMPRNDIFFNKELVEQTNLTVRTQLHIEENDLVVLYAPTYRGSSLNASKFSSELDINNLKQALMKKYNKNVKVIFRGHYFFTTDNSINSFDLNVSSYPVMQELLCAADILITDYSSSMWDFSLTKKPCILYCPDLDNYIKNRGFYTEPEQWGFPIAKSNEEIPVLIQNFNQADYEQNLQKAFKFFNSFENGTSSYKVVKLIKEHL